jgi:hypothetical protein
VLKPNEAKAAKCRQLAEQAKDPDDRERWLSMERLLVKADRAGQDDTRQRGDDWIAGRWPEQHPPASLRLVKL